MKIDDDYELYSFLRQIASMPSMSKEDFARLKAEREKLRNQTQNATVGRTNSAEQNKETDKTGNPGMDANIASGQEESK